MSVDFFFVLSGFIMAYTYAGDSQRRGTRALGPFLAKRVARIAPLNAVVLVAIVLAGLASVALTGRNVVFASRSILPDFLANLLMLQRLGIGTNLNGPSWSISTEFAAYLLFPLLVVVIFGARTWRVSAVATALTALGGLAMLQPRLGLAFDNPPHSVVRCFAEFTLGMAACTLLGNVPVIGVLRRDAVAFSLAAAVAALLLAGLDLLVVVLLPFLVVAFAVNTGAAAKCVQLRFFYFLGVISFSLYLIHNPFRPLALELLRLIAPQPVGPAGALGFALLASLSVILPAWGTFVWIERPGRSWGRKLLGAAAFTPGPRPRQPSLRAAP